jgi:hypothetical protein
MPKVWSPIPQPLPELQIAQLVSGFHIDPQPWDDWPTYHLIGFWNTLWFNPFDFMFLVHWDPDAQLPWETVSPAQLALADMLRQAPDLICQCCTYCVSRYNHPSQLRYGSLTSDSIRWGRPVAADVIPGGLAPDFGAWPPVYWQ